MKKLLLYFVIAAVSCSVTILPITVYAEDGCCTQEDLVKSEPAFPDPSRTFCPKCGTLGDIIRSWVEYNYYGVQIWYSYECPSCHFIWNAAFTLNTAGVVEDPVIQ
ncbi:MAG: hypothetical protein HUJ69_03315 [Lachnospiraceae bacterium]|nr:hypothetical protein [Lachnospiraceae bacterium]